MGINLAQIQRFSALVDTALKDSFPATISIGGTQYACCGVGGDAMMDMRDGGQVPTGVRFFRISKTLLATRPTVGTQVTVISGPNSETALTIMEVPDRPHETSWVIHCVPKNR